MFTKEPQRRLRVLRNERIEVGELQLIGLDYLNTSDDAVDL